MLIETIEYIDIISNNRSIENYYYNSSKLLVKINGVSFYDNGNDKDYYTIEIKYQGDFPTMVTTTWPGAINIINDIKLLNNTIYYDFHVYDTRYSLENIEVKEKDIEIDGDIYGNTFLFEDMYTPAKDSMRCIRRIGININSGKILIQNIFAKNDIFESNPYSITKVILKSNDEYEVYLDDIVISSFIIEHNEEYLIFYVKNKIENNIIAKLIIKYRKENSNTLLIINDA